MDRSIVRTTERCGGKRMEEREREMAMAAVTSQSKNALHTREPQRMWTPGGDGKSRPEGITGGSEGGKIKREKPVRRRR